MKTIFFQLYLSLAQTANSGCTPNFLPGTTAGLSVRPKMSTHSSKQLTLLASWPQSILSKSLKCFPNLLKCTTSNALDRLSINRSLFKSNYQNVKFHYVLRNTSTVHINLCKNSQTLLNYLIYWYLLPQVCLIH